MLIANYPTKKALKQARGQKLDCTEITSSVREYSDNGTLTVIGQNRKWNATVVMRNGIIVRVD